MKYFAECTFEKTASVEQKKLQFFSPRIFFLPSTRVGRNAKEEATKMQFCQIEGNVQQQTLSASYNSSFFTFYEQDDINAVLSHYLFTFNNQILIEYSHTWNLNKHKFVMFQTALIYL